MSGIKVGIRVRPWMSTDGPGDPPDTLCIEMNGPQTKIFDPKGVEEERTFTYDYSFQSHQGFKVREDGYSEPDGPGSTYHDQAHVMKVIGIDVLDNAWSGYHACLFAYGQTGSGKSYSMIGYGANKGIVPLCCTEIFKRISENTDPEKGFEVEY